MGGSIYVHMFGAYFGCALSAVYTNKALLAKYHDKYEKGDYNSQLISMIGTLFLFCYWPSFNAVFAEGNA